MAGLGRRSHYRKHLTDSVLHDLPELTNSNQRIAKVVGTRGSNQFELVVAPPTPPSPNTTSTTTKEVDNVSSDAGIDADADTNIDIGNDIDIDMTPQLSILPTKYRKLIWLKRNDYVICECAEDDNDDNDDDDDDDDDRGQAQTQAQAQTQLQVNHATKNNENKTSSNKNTNTNTNTIESGGGIRYMITHILYKDQIKHLKEKHMWPIHSFFASHAGGQKKNQIRGSGSDDQIQKENELLMERAKALIKVQQEQAQEQEQEQEQIQVDNNDNGLNGVEEGEGKEGKIELNDGGYISEDDYSDDNGDNDNDDDNDDGIVFSNNNDDYFVNMNRIAKLKIDDSSSDEDSD